VIRGGDITIYERMLLASLRFPFLPIAREFVLFLGMALSQVMPNAWRYLFASFIPWHTMVGARITILEFFNIYCTANKKEGVMEFTVCTNPTFISLS
jgi:hypothetical protein